MCEMCGKCVMCRLLRLGSAMWYAEQNESAKRKEEERRERDAKGGFVFSH